MSETCINGREGCAYAGTHFHTLEEIDGAMAGVTHIENEVTERWDALRARVEELEGLIREVTGSGVDLTMPEDPRYRYIEVQIDRELWERLREVKP